MNDSPSIAWLGLDAHSKNCVLGQLDDQGTEVNLALRHPTPAINQTYQGHSRHRQAPDARRIQPRPLDQPIA